VPTQPSKRMSISKNQFKIIKLKDDAYLYCCHF